MAARTIDDWSPDETIASLRRDGVDVSDLEIMVRAIRRADGVNLDSKSPAYVRAYYEHAAASGRVDALGDVIGDPDPDDTNHRASRGANSAVRNARSMPDVDSMDLGATKRLAASVGAYSSAIRRELATKVLDRLRELGAPTVAHLFAKAWAYGDLDKESDDEAEKAGDAHSDAEAIAQANLRSANRALLSSPSKADSVRAKSAIARARSK